MELLITEIQSIEFFWQKNPPKQNNVVKCFCLHERDALYHHAFWNPFYLFLTVYKYVADDQGARTSAKNAARTHETPCASTDPETPTESTRSSKA